MEYKKQLIKFDVSKMSIFSVILFAVPFVIALCINLLAFKRPLLVTDAVYWDILIIIAIFIVGLVAHEGLHALSGMLFARVKPKDINFGIIPKQLMLYCHINTPITVKQYMIVLIVPAIVTGLIPLIISAFLGNIFLISVFALLFSGGAGDFIMFASLLKRDKSSLILDHAEAPAYYLLYPADKLPEDFEEVTDEQEKELKDSMDNGNKGDKGRSNMMKILVVLIFLALTVLAVFLIALFMKLF